MSEQLQQLVMVLPEAFSLADDSDVIVYTIPDSLQLFVLDYHQYYGLHQAIDERARTNESNPYEVMVACYFGELGKVSTFPDQWFDELW